MARIVTLLWMCFLVVSHAQTPTAQGMGTLKGLVTDAAGGVIPGATITATSGAVTRSAVSNAAGKFEFTALPTGWYRVDAALAGFTTQTVDPVAVTAGRTKTLSFRLELGPLAIVDYVTFPLASNARRAAVIAHVRLGASIQAGVREHVRSTEWVADVITVAKDPADLVVGRRVQFLRDADLPGAFATGQEFIALFSTDRSGRLRAVPYAWIEVVEGLLQWRGTSQDGISAGMPVATALSTISALAKQGTGGPGRETEQALKPGMSSPWWTTSIGVSREFTNDIYSLRCWPVTITGERVLMWITRLHTSTGRTFVQPCEELNADPAVLGAQYRPAAASSWLFEASMNDDAEYPQMVLRRLALPGFGEQANAAFCGRSVAYWSLERDRNTQEVALSARVADLFGTRQVVTQRLGPAMLETDNPGAFEAAVWDTQCEVATMSGQRYGLPVVKVAAPPRTAVR
jgi:hypothetical protein